MTIKKCSCGKIVTTKTANIIGKQIMGEKNILFFNCPCGSTLIIKAKTKGIKNDRG